MQTTTSPRPQPSYVVLRQEPDESWRVVGEARRQPGLTARKARAKAVVDATNGAARPGEVYAVLPSSEWRVAQDI